jgi:PPOX class probable F420-dependent enzyme
MHHRPMPTPPPPLTADQLAFLAAARTASLATIARDGLPRLVPICFVVDDGPPVAIHTPLDDKPKRVADVHDLQRVRDILARPEVALLVERWSEDWSRLGWLRLGGTATLVEPGEARREHAAAVDALRAKYPQYGHHRLEERPLIRIAIVSARSWGSLAVTAPGTAPRPPAGGSASSSSPGGSRRR